MSCRWSWARLSCTDFLVQGIDFNADVSSANDHASRCRLRDKFSLATLGPLRAQLLGSNPCEATTTPFKHHAWYAAMPGRDAPPVPDHGSYCPLSPYHQIVKRQARHCRHLIRGIHPPRSGVTISLRNNTVVGVINGDGRVHGARRMQHTRLFERLCATRRVPDCDVNINLGDHPLAGVFTFCRRPGPEGVLDFMLPTSRFTMDDVLLSAGARVKDSLRDYDEVVRFLQSIDSPFEVKEPRAYVSVFGHAAAACAHTALAQTPAQPEHT